MIAHIAVDRHPMTEGLLSAGDYDSEETGTEESGSDISEDESVPPLEDDGSEGSNASVEDADQKPLVKKHK